MHENTPAAFHIAFGDKDVESNSKNQRYGWMSHNIVTSDQLQAEESEREGQRRQKGEDSLFFFWFRDFFYTLEPFTHV